MLGPLEVRDGERSLPGAGPAVAGPGRCGQAVDADRSATDAAAIVPMYTLRSVDVVSERVGNYQHPFWGVLLNQLWVK